MSDKKYYITTPIFYVNDVPHIGHSYTAVAADVLKRYMLFSGRKGYLLTGTDEHGQKIQKTAEEQGIEPKLLADRVVSRFLSLWKVLDIKYDDFIRTTDKRHFDMVQKFFSKMKESGDIYFSQYEGWYCTPCETFWTEAQLTDDMLCPDCGRPVEKVSEDSYFFKLSKYEQPLLEYFKQNPEFVEPASKFNEVKSMVEHGLRDISISRKSVQWGIPLPDAEDYTVYVWFDALINYVTATGYSSDENKYESLWPADVHIIGKDILKFHAVIWPAMLMSAGLPLPKKVYAHGWWTVEGEKMSKSKGNVVDPNTEIEKYGVDAYRYFLLRDVPFGSDGDYSRTSLINRINADLANDLGNLVSRIIGMLDKYRNRQVPAAIIEEPAFAKVKERASQIFKEIDELYGHLRFNIILDRIWELISMVNKYIVEIEPWSLAKQGDKAEMLDTVLYNLLDSLRILAILIYPFMPQKSQELWEMLALSGMVSDAALNDLQYGLFPPGITTNEKHSLFVRIDEKNAD